MRRALTALLFSGAASLGCDKSGSLVGVNCNDVVYSPGGPIARACVHEVPNGATVAETFDGTTVVTLDGKVVATYPPCPCASLGSVGPDLDAAPWSPPPNDAMDGPGPADATATAPDPVACGKLMNDFATALSAAKTCDPKASDQCQKKVTRVLQCSDACGIVVNDDDVVAAVQSKWDQSGCDAIYNTCSPGCLVSTLGACVAQADGGGVCDP
jgi:hypothetical protein